MIELEWATLVEAGGIGAICIAVIYTGFKMFKIFTDQWGKSTEAVNKNTEAFQELSKVFERSHEREIEFQTHVKDKLSASERRERETLEKVIEIHSSIKYEGGSNL